MEDSTDLFDNTLYPPWVSELLQSEKGYFKGGHSCPFFLNYFFKRSKVRSSMSLESDKGEGDSKDPKGRL